MFTEILETRRFLSVTLQPGPQPDYATVTQDNNGNVTISAQKQKKTAGGSKVAGGSKAMVLNVAVQEDNGSLTVTEIQTGATWTVDGATSVKINGTKNADNIFYTDTTIGASITGGSGADTIVVADTGTGSSNIDSGNGNDSINLLVGNNTHIKAGGGDDTVSLNSGVGVYNTAASTAIVDMGGGNDIALVYAGQADVNGAGGHDNAIVFVSNGASANVTDADVTFA